MLGLLSLSPASEFGAFTRCVVDHDVQRTPAALQHAACAECTLPFAASMHGHLSHDDARIDLADELNVERTTIVWQCVCARSSNMAAHPDAGQVSAYFSSCMHSEGATPFELQAQALFDEALAAQARARDGPFTADDFAMLLFPPCWLASWVLATISWRRRRYNDESAERLAALV